MAFRIRKSFKIAPGLRVNVSKSGLSTSVGGKGTTVNLSKRGTKVTNSIPGTGISTSKLYGSGKAQKIFRAAPVAKPGIGSYLLTLLIIAGALWAIFHK